MTGRAIALLICLLFILSPAFAEGNIIGYRFADADEAAELLLSNREYYENLTRNDLDFRMQKPGATLEELEAFAAAQTLDFTETEKRAIGAAVGAIEDTCRERGYTLPPTDNIVFAKTTMREECDADAYTHGTQIYFGQSIMEDALSGRPGKEQRFREYVAHELFHCLTRNHPDFRAAMYGILGFTVVDTDFVFPPEIGEIIISNPDVEHHNAYASFNIGGDMRDCVVIYTTVKMFEKPGDSFIDDRMTGLVPIDDPGTMYTADDAANFWDVFGRNTNYVIDPEETMADNFRFTIVRGVDGAAYKSPEIIEAIDAYLRSGPVDRAAARPRNNG